jgi:hypothetical protein
MIKCNVTVIGTVSRPVELKNGRDGKPFVTFGLNVLVKDNQESKNIDISVASDGEDDDSLSLSKGDRVKLKGVLSLKRIGDATYFNLSADELSLNPKGADSITGQVQFRGTLGSKEVVEKMGKKGAFRTFDAYSSEKIGEQQYSYIWVHFIDFSEESPEWLVPKAKIEVNGKLELQIFKGSPSINCRVESITEWIRENTNQ